MDLNDKELKVVLSALASSEWPTTDAERQLAQRIARQLGVWDEYLHIVDPEAHQRELDALWDLSAKPVDTGNRDPMNPLMEQYTDDVSRIRWSRFPGGF